MPDTLTRQQFREILQHSSTPSISIYMPTHPGGREARQDALRLKNLLKEAERRLEAQGFAARDYRDVLRPAAELVTDDTFWTGVGHALAILLAGGDYRVVKLPIKCPESVTVSDRYQIRPLLSALDEQHTGYVLALSHDHVQLYRVTHSDAQSVAVPELPRNMEEALNYSAVSGGAQMHSAGPTPKRKQAAVFHGQGGRHDTAKQDLEAYCRFVNDAVAAFLHGSDTPLLLASVSYVAAVYRDVNTYAHLQSESIEGSPDRWTSAEVQAKAWPRLESIFAQPKQQQRDRFRELEAGPRAVQDTDEIVAAASAGQVEVLLFDQGREVWGCFDPQQSTVDVHDVRAAEGEDLIELAVRETLRHDGRVFALSEQEMPAPTPLAAILRYAPETAAAEMGG